ncbi:hypothetical protein [Variovorax sp. LT1R16]|uniref:hypothetical protein n=1 Tax=Variovorax sp. LT1R16 TaxID=3443728 RepID=UPI003F48C73D
MSRISFLLLSLALMLCGHGWVAVMHDVQVSATERVGQEATWKASSLDLDPEGSSLQYDNSSEASDFDNAAIVGMPRSGSEAVFTAYRHRTRSPELLPFRWLECPMRPPRPAALLA